MAQAIEDKKKSDPEEVGDSNPQGPGESGIEETTTARKIEGALEEITRSVAGVAELIQENGSPEIPEKEDIEDIEKQLQELNTLTQPISEPASASLTQIPEDHVGPGRTGDGTD